MNRLEILIENLKNQRETVRQGARDCVIQDRILSEQIDKLQDISEKCEVKDKDQVAKKQSV